MNQITTRPATWKKQVGWFLLSQNISLLGSSAVGFVIIWHITPTTSSGVWIMLSTTCSILLQVLVSLIGGVQADRYNRKYLIMLSDGFIATVTFGLAIASLLGLQRLELPLVVSIVCLIGAGIQTPAAGAVYPQLVPQESLTKVQGINQTSNSVLLLSSPAVGGVILGWVGIVNAFFVDAATATLAIFVMSRTTIERIHSEKESDSMWAGLKTGINYIFRHPQLRNLTLCYMAFFFLITPTAVFPPLLVERTFGSEIWKPTVNEMVWTVGSLTDGIFVVAKGEFRNKAKAVSFCLAVLDVFFVLMGVAWNFVSYLTSAGIPGFFLSPLSTAQTVHIQEITEPEVLGRVSSIVQLIAASAMPMAILLFGLLADVVSVESTPLVTGVLLVLVGILHGRTASVNSSVDHQIEG